MMVDYCTEGGGVAGPYCSDYGDVSSRALVRLTSDEVEEIRAAAHCGLVDGYLNDGYVYYLDGDWHGFSGNANYGENAPYVGCPVHSSAYWDEGDDFGGGNWDDEYDGGGADMGDDGYWG